MASKKTISLPLVNRSAAFKPATLNPDDRTVDVVWSTGEIVRRDSYFDGPYLESLSLDPSHVDLSRLNAGAPILDTHNRYSIDGVIGVVERAWIEGGQALATVRFSKRAAVEPIFQDVRDGILRNISVGARVFEFEQIANAKDELPHFVAVNWSPEEISFCPVGADAGAVTRAAPATHPCTITRADVAHEGEGTMTPEEIAAAAATAPATPAVPAAETTTTPVTPDPEIARAAREQGAAAERERAKLIRQAARAGRLEDAFADALIERGATIDVARDEVLRELARRDAGEISGRFRVGEDHDAVGPMVERMADAIVARATGRAPADNAREFFHATLVEMSADLLTLRRVPFEKRNRIQIVERALTSSDFPNLLANAANKILRPVYDLAEPTYRKLSARQDLADFKTATVLKVGDFPNLLKVGEDGEIKLGSFSEAKDTFALATYARRLFFARQAIINDDLNAFGAVMGAYARRVADFENALWFTLLTSASGAGPTLGDTGALFNATAVTTAGGHANLTSSGTAISVDSIGVGRAAMRKQVSLDGLKLNLIPRFILTSPEKEQLGRQYSSAIQPTQGSNVNPWAGTVEPLADANLTSANPWYLFADPMLAPVMAHGYLAGASGPQVATRQGFEVSGVEMKVELDFGVGAIDFRGAYRNAGA